jgi:uncharacterized protein
LRNLWRIYDALIDALPDVPVSACLCGLHWVAAKSQGVGLAMTPSGAAELPQAGDYADLSVRELARMAKSWNLHEAALGMAAINSVYNGPAAVAQAFGRPPAEMPDANIFDFLIDAVRGKNVTVIGHFPNLDSWRKICNLTVLERAPQSGDTPDPACEWVLPEQDIVVSTAVTLINKTLPRILELSQGAKFVLAGPTTPLTPKLFEFGIDILAGLVIEDEEKAMTVIGQGGQHRLFATGGRMVTLCREYSEWRI